jgi:AcrR family transcriptional regulator
MSGGKRTGRPRDVDSAETRSRIVGVARLRFSCDGYEATTNRSIAAASGLSSSAIYHYFPSKAELYVAVFEEVFERMFGEFEKAILDLHTLIDQYAAVLHACAVLNREDPSLPAFVVGIASDAQRHPELAELLRPLQRRNNVFFRRLVKEAYERGELDDDVDLRAVEDLLNSVISGLARLAAVTRDCDRHTAAVDVLHQFLAGTLVRTPAR